MCSSDQPQQPLGPQQELPPEGFSAPPDFNTPNPPMTTRRIGSPVSGCFVNGAAFMLCLISKKRGFSPVFCGMVS